ncbi:unnamed protein product [Heligmosomoides polygyrus]|uniref:Secreted protein n=1 Tax=Heligmosomoides polygyrus TaxID=6339 RepID=A0A183FMF4_HELPZ|nr:unnamed protein product [Heligmosomoides polygyrus]
MSGMRCACQSMGRAFDVPVCLLSSIIVRTHRRRCGVKPADRSCAGRLRFCIPSAPWWVCGRRKGLGEELVPLALEMYEEAPV